MKTSTPDVQPSILTTPVANSKKDTVEAFVGNEFVLPFNNDKKYMPIR